MKHKLLEAGKTLLIAVLIGTLLLLTAIAVPKETIRSTPWLSNILQPLAPFLGLQEAELAYVEDAVPVISHLSPGRVTRLRSLSKVRCTRSTRHSGKA